MDLIIPKDYDPKLDVKKTQEAIRYIRETFQDDLAKSLAYHVFQHQCM